MGLASRWSSLVRAAAVLSSVAKKSSARACRDSFVHRSPGFNGHQMGQGTMFPFGVSYDKTEPIFSGMNDSLEKCPDVT